MKLISTHVPEQMPSDDEDYVVPLQDQRVFGAGIKRKRIAFIPAASDERTSQPPNDSEQNNIGDRYLSIVLPKSASRTPEPVGGIPSTTADTNEILSVCNVCKQLIDPSTNTLATEAHESSIVHQVCLQHSHPPSHLDRDHVGVRYLSNYGWDPDSRKGLGSSQEGIRVPIKAREKRDTVGLREQIDSDDISLKKKKPVKKEEKPKRLDAGAVRKQEMEMKKKAERLRSFFYGQDLSEYLDDGPSQPVQAQKTGIGHSSNFNPS